MNIVCSPKPRKGGGSKTQSGRFQYKIALYLKKACYKAKKTQSVQNLNNNMR